MMPQINAQRSTFNAQRSRLQTSASLRLCVKIPDPKTHSRAFTLIETALALLAIGLGLLGLFGLGRIGLQSAKESESDQRCAMMADAVFETLRETNARFTDEARTNSVPWGDRWIGVLSNGTPLPFPPVANMSDDDTLTLHFWQQGESFPTPAYVPTNLRLSDWNPRYRLFMSGENQSHVAQAVNAIQLTLEIYPDGDTYSSDYRLFHTTLSNPGGLP